MPIRVLLPDPEQDQFRIRAATFVQAGKEPRRGSKAKGQHGGGGGGFSGMGTTNQPSAQPKAAPLFCCLDWGGGGGRRQTLGGMDCPGRRGKGGLRGEGRAFQQPPPHEGYRVLRTGEGAGTAVARGGWSLSR